MTSTVCGWCERLSHVTGVPGSGTVTYERNQDHSVVSGAFNCDNCSNLLIARVSLAGVYSSSRNSILEWVEQLSDDEGEALIWLPKRGVSRSFPDVPSHISEAASEAYECFSIGANRAAVALGRAVIEATAKDRGIVSGNLNSKINQMAETNLIRPHIKEVAHELRHLGNDMAHGDFIDPVSSDEVDLALTLMSEVLAEVFQSPARLERVRAAREAKRSGS